MNSDLQKEILLVLENYEPAICGPCQVKILAKCTQFVNNEQYMKQIKVILDPIFANNREFNFWVEIPKIISAIIEFNKTIVSTNEISINKMKFVIYSIIYSYFDNHQSILLNKQDPGDLRIIFMNVLHILLTKPKKIKVKKQSLFSIIFNCIFGNNKSIKI